MNLLGTVKNLLLSDTSTRYRDKRAFYASSALSCLRDQYWEATGVPTTNKTDVTGKLRMLAGSAVENELIKQIFSQLHLFGLHTIATQVPVGGSKPNWDGYIDALVGEKTATGIQKYAIEIKTASGYGADALYNGESPKDGYLAQLGLYLKDLHEKGITRFGKLFYVLLSDKNFGTIMVVDVEYVPETTDVIARAVHYSNKESRELYGVKINLQERVLNRWLKLEEHIAKGITPPPEYHYKTPLTPDFLKAMSTDQLKKAWRGEKILGDWQVRYSRYFDKIMLESGESRSYTEDERNLIKQEHDARLTEKGNKVRPLKEKDTD